MPEHYTKNTTAVMKFCNRCGRNTMHKVSGGRIGLCIEQHATGEKKQVKV